MLVGLVTKNGILLVEYARRELIGDQHLGGRIAGGEQVFEQVRRVMPTAAAVTGAHGIPVGYGALAASYLVVAGGLAWVLRRLARSPLEPPESPESRPDLQPA